jgi:single-strand DNA-binding protein
VERYTTDIIASDMKMLGNRSGSGSFESPPDHEEDNPVSSRSSPPAKAPAGFDDMDDDIPF